MCQGCPSLSWSLTLNPPLEVQSPSPQFQPLWPCSACACAREPALLSASLLPAALAEPFPEALPPSFSSALPPSCSPRYIHYSCPLCEAHSSLGEMGKKTEAQFTSHPKALASLLPLATQQQSQPVNTEVRVCHSSADSLSWLLVLKEKPASGCVCSLIAPLPSILRSGCTALLFSVHSCLGPLPSAGSCWDGSLVVASSFTQASPLIQGRPWLAHPRAPP